MFSQQEIKDFLQEALELLSEAEDAFLSLERGETFAVVYDAVFRAFHSVKGGAGMTDLKLLLAHMHKLEDQLGSLKDETSIPKTTVDYFLAAIDTAREVVAGGNPPFDFKAFRAHSTSTAAATGVSPTNRTVAAGASNPVSAPKPQVAPLVKPNSVGHCVVVDDEQEIVDFVTSQLSRAGFSTWGSCSPVKALDYILNNPVDVVVSDQRMPELNGVELAKKISESKPDLAIVLISGHLEGSMVLSGIYAIIEKPFPTDFLVHTTTLAARRYQTTKLLSKAVDLLMYQFSDLDDFLKKEGREQIRKTLHQEIRSVVSLRAQLRELNKNTLSSPKDLNK